MVIYNYKHYATMYPDKKSYKEAMAKGRFRDRYSLQRWGKIAQVNAPCCMLLAIHAPTAH